MTEFRHLGTLYGIGVGPGDPELLSIKGLRCIEQCPIVAYPAGIKGQQGVAEQIVAPWLTTQSQLPLVFPYVQDLETLQAAWQQAALTVWDYLAQGQDIAFACEGDIGLYSTFTYLAETLLFLHPQVCIQRIPGISSPMAAAAALNMPLTLQNDRLAIVPALQRIEDLTATLAWADVIVLLKVSRVYLAVWQVLKQHNLLQASFVVVHASQEDQRIYRNLVDYPDLHLPYFSLLVVSNNRGAPSGAGDH